MNLRERAIQAAEDWAREREEAAQREREIIHANQKSAFRQLLKTKLNVENADTLPIKRHWRHLSAAIDGLVISGPITESGSIAGLALSVTCSRGHTPPTRPIKDLVDLGAVLAADSFWCPLCGEHFSCRQENVAQTLL